MYLESDIVTTEPTSVAQSYWPEWSPMAGRPKTTMELTLFTFSDGRKCAARTAKEACDWLNNNPKETI